MSQIASEAAVDVPEAFDGVASRYDLMVGLNPGYHRHLRSAAEALVERLPAGTEPVQLLDLGCGSGASTRALVNAMDRRSRPFRLTAIDGSVGMLEQARRKTWPPGVRFEYRLAEDLSAARADWGLTEAVGGVFAAYLFRNVGDRDKVLKATHELLAPGGSLVIQEYSVAGSQRSSFIWNLVCWSLRDPVELAAHAGDPALPLPVAQRARLRLRRGLRRAVVRGRFRRRGGPYGARLAARRAALVPRAARGCTVRTLAP